MKFAHIADCHIGGWREQELKVLGIKSLKKAAEICIKENVAFLLVCGDLFNTSLPQIDMVGEVANIFNKLREKNIDAYIIPGSHDYSPSGKTMLDVLEKAGLVINVMKFENDKLKFTEDKTGVKITGLYGRRSSLEKIDYSTLIKDHLEKEKGFKIFMFHTTLEEFKPKELEKVQGESYTNMPKNFNYYAGGHVHYLFDTEKEGYGKIVYPGPLFPNNFKELEEIKYGYICIVDDKLNFKRVEIKLKEVESIKINVNSKNAQEVNEIINEELNKRDLKDKIVTLRIFGELGSGKVSDINFNDMGKDVGAYIILKNINNLKSKVFEKAEVEGSNAEEIEEIILKENKGYLNNEEKLSKELMNILNEEKHEGEKNLDFEKRMILNLLKLFKNENK